MPMIEIVFSESACGSLKMAKSFKGTQTGTHINGMVLGEEETNKNAQARAFLRAKKREREAWKAARPVEGGAGDVFGFPLALSTGDISETVPGPAREKVLRGLSEAVWPNASWPASGRRRTEEAKEALQRVGKRIAAGEAVRIWYSEQPDERCGLYWMAEQLERLGQRKGPVCMVKLPRCERRRDGVIVTRSGWNEVAPQEWGRYVPLQRSCPPEALRACALRWRELQRENAPLRVCLNGRLVSAGADFYDGFIRRETARMEAEFKEALVISAVIGNCRLGISDGWIAMRLDAMTERGELQVASPGPEDAPVMGRLLRKGRLK